MKTAFNCGIDKEYDENAREQSNKLGSKWASDECRSVAEA